MDKDLNNGLSPEIALQRLHEDGPNELGISQRRTLRDIVLDVMREPMFLLLIGAGMLYLLMGDAHEALILLGFVSIIITITILQERRTDNALEALREMSSPRALVIRGGVAQRIPGREVVRDDILIVSEGDRVAADGVLLESHELATDESMLTGESEVVEKQKLGDQLYAGTLVVRGQGLMRVSVTGYQTEFGRIGRSLDVIGIQTSPLREHVAALTKRLAVIGIVLCVVLMVLFFLLRGGLIQSILAGITLAMAVLPQELPVIMIVFFALAARRLALQKVLTRRLGAIETLGQTTVLCVDKTGTLTENQMSVAALSIPSAEFNVQGLGERQLPDEFHELVEYAVLASEIDPHDPMEKAFHELGRAQLLETKYLHPEWILAREYELSPKLLSMTHLWRCTDTSFDMVAAKGAPEAVAELCHLGPSQMLSITAKAAAMADQGLRVLGVAKARHVQQSSWPALQHDFQFEWVGLIGLADPLRKDVVSSVAQCAQAGIRVIMITGDHPRTALAIASQAGISSQKVLTGDEIAGMDDSTFRRYLQTVNIFARVKPQQKLQLVDALKAQGEVVAMTGDGVNDAPALKSAHIGIAMGRRGTDVAREAASLVLLEDNFSSILAAIHRGRKTFANLRKAMIYTLAVHIPIVGLAIIPVLFGLPILLAPLHIAFLELVIDPACSIVFESEDRDTGLMQQPPRKTDEPLISTKMLWLSISQGVLVTIAVIGLFKWMLDLNFSSGMAACAAFLLLVTANAVMIFSNRSMRFQWRGLFQGISPVSIWVLSGTMAALIVITAVPMVAEAFRFELLSPVFWSMVVLAGVMMIVPMQLIKWLLISPKQD
ncbi:MAG: cation-translocating P-type ATPase [Sheuella sp.]|nr:cation-translocating P-type ATPase [Sheuella sp.]